MDFDLESIKKYYGFRSKKEKLFQDISEEISEDLNLDFLFFKLNKTNSKIGKQYFYSKFRIIETEQDKQLQEYTEYFTHNNSIPVEQELDKLNKSKDYEILDLILNDIYVNPKYLNYAKLSIALLFVIVILGFFAKQMLLFLLPLFMANAYYHYANKNYVEYYNLIISRLHKTLTVAKNIGRNAYFAKEYQSIPLKKLKGTFWTSNVSVQLAKNEFLIFFWLITELLKIAFNLEIFGFSRKVKILNAAKPELLRVYEYIGKIDTANNLSKIKNDYPNCTPVFVDKKQIEVQDMHHPLIDDCVTNSLDIENSSIVLTGSNMSGKTSFMRCFAINVIFAQSFGFCFAKAYKAPFMKILSSISIQDNITESKSYYLQEVLRIQHFLNETPQFQLVLIDEIFRGTNAKERIAISKAVLKAINTDHHIVFVTTHDLEIAHYLEGQQYKLFFFSEEVDKDEIKFTFKINPGINTKTNAIRILEMYNYPEHIISESYGHLDS
ncbi:MutS-related protein [Elizabethkingia meningoseptica]|uniref:MutS-related protein n=1 Tax=Elizabethkingia meningoseptica TaxID=238 RepID=UPI0038913E0A